MVWNEEYSERFDELRKNRVKTSYHKYGIYNKQKKEFQFGICEDTPMLAEARLFQKIGDDAKKWRFEVREVREVTT